jgi:ribonuclease R
VKFKDRNRRHKNKQELRGVKQKVGRKFAGPGTKDDGNKRVVGVLKKTPQGWNLLSTNRRDKGEYTVHAKTNFELNEGHLAVAEVASNQRYGAKSCKIIEVLGDANAPRAVSLIAIAANDIPHGFDRDAVREAEAAQPVTLDGRTDMRSIPLITIDGEDARDFDDAVFAEADGDNGWHLVVAIADVSHYVKSGSALDISAYARGNSVYFPDRVVPMLPEALSNELCSLKPHVERACMAAHMWLNSKGEMVRWQFVRGVMKSHARLTYEQAQRAIDGNPDATIAPLVDKVIKPLYAAFKCLLQARLERGTLELDLPERKVEIDKDGQVRAIKVRDRFDSHKLIEEFMICANVAAAAQLEGKGGICIYRVHDKPSELKLMALREFLDSIGISLVPAKQIHSRFLTQILDQHAGGPHAQVINEVMLRSQAQAIYSPDNIGHFGLALGQYAHFTSPIRRYADLVVHRALIRACKLGDDGLPDADIPRLEEIAEHISGTERRAVTAERDATDRYIALFMVDRVGTVFPARISGVARFGLFARLDETGADGIIPIHTLPQDYYVHDEKRQALVGKKSRRVYALAQPVMVRLEQADRLTGGMSFTIIEGDEDKKDKPSPHSGGRPTTKTDVVDSPRSKKPIGRGKRDKNRKPKR